MKNRYFNLDALRGYAIFTMILSGSIAYGDSLPAWMFHAQVPPPLHKFNPNLAGITWVDLVFPFFIFCMGAAIPISLQKHIATQNNRAVIFNALRRFAFLAFFGLFLEHLKADQIKDLPETSTYLLSIAGFLVLLFSFSKLRPIVTIQMETIINWGSLGIGILLLAFYSFNKGAGFQLNKTDIIILVLANMALFGTIIWWLTRSYSWLRLGLLPFIMAVFLGSKEIGSWNDWLFHLTPEVWIYRFYFLKYLFILIPGTFLGEWLINDNDIPAEAIQKSKPFTLLSSLILVLIIANLYNLFTRHLIFNVLFTGVLLLFAWVLIINKNALPNQSLIKKLFIAGSYSLFLGLFFEAYEGGIKKDFSTYSYYFVTSGLAFLIYIPIAYLQTLFFGKPVHRFFVLVGQNPMMAYVSGNLLLIPLLHIFGVYGFWNGMNGNAFLGFSKGFIFTLAVCFFTIPFTKKGLVWKT